MIDDKLTRSEHRNQYEGHRECDKYNVYILKALGENNRDIELFPMKKKQWYPNHSPRRLNHEGGGGGGASEGC